jgi:hypothetical protein
MTVSNVGKEFFHWLTDVLGTSNSFCPLGTAFRAWLTATVTKEVAHYFKSLVVFCLSLHGVTSEKTVTLLSYVTAIRFIAFTDKSTNSCVVDYK